jgi:nucleoside-diphosphate-sugar epimerase
MNLAVTGADQPMGTLLCERLATVHDVRPVAATALNVPTEAAAAIQGADMIVHAQPHDPVIVQNSAADGELLETISRNTYVLVQAAVAAHISRVVLISQMRLFDDVPDQYIVDAGWQPRPRPEAASLAPYMAELVCREISRTGKIEAVNLRMGTLDAVDGTSADDAVASVQSALSLDMTDGYHWQERHVVSGGRFAPPARTQS